MAAATTTTTREPREASRREGRDSHGRRTHSSSRSRRDDPSPRRWRNDRRRHESDRSQYRRRAEESTEAGDRGERRNRPLRDAQAQRDDPLRVEGKPLSDARDDPTPRHERSPRGTKRFSEQREAWRPRSFFQVGIIHGINKFNIDLPNINLAVSLYAPDQDMDRTAGLIVLGSIHCQTCAFNLNKRLECLEEEASNDPRLPWWFHLLHRIVPDCYVGVVRQLSFIMPRRTISSSSPWTGTMPSFPGATRWQFDVHPCTKTTVRLCFVQASNFEIRSREVILHALEACL